jgi:hypothetical protein
MRTGEHQSWLLVVSDAVYRSLLVCYPKAFRAAYGAEVAQVFRDRAREVYRGRGVGGLLALWVAALRDLAANAAAEQAGQERHVSRKIVVLAVVLMMVVIVGEYLYDGALEIANVTELLVIKPVFNLLVVVYAYVHSLPLALVIVTLAFQLCLLPMVRLQLRATRALRSLQPQLQQLHEQYHGEPQALRMTQREVYRMHGISSVSITVWLLIQVPFQYALYGAFLTFLPRTPISAAVVVRNVNGHLYAFVPNLTTLPDMHFLWTNLVTPDPLAHLAHRGGGAYVHCAAYRDEDSPQACAGHSHSVRRDEAGHQHDAVHRAVPYALHLLDVCLGPGALLDRLDGVHPGAVCCAEGRRRWTRSARCGRPDRWRCLLAKMGWPWLLAGASV